ncbi:hypothetical protein C8039_02300 [Halogeometricum sp. wsp3]|nr:hypothetical protein C8039_02300 [Halogeometricum sp. wsp3]
MVAGDCRRQKLPELVHRRLVAVSDDFERLVTELAKRLAAHPTGSDAVSLARGDSDAFERPVPVADSRTEATSSSTSFAV